MENVPRYSYDEEGDIFYITFHPGEKGTAVELNGNILLRLDRKREKALGLTLFDFSILVQKTDFGPRGFPLTGLMEIPHDLRDIVIKIITTPPVSHFLKVATYSPTLSESIPITYIEKPLDSSQVKDGVNRNP
jgi:uncharacterized protein YuzE